VFPWAFLAELQCATQIISVLNGYHCTPNTSVQVCIWCCLAIWGIPRDFADNLQQLPLELTFPCRCTYQQWCHRARSFFWASFLWLSRVAGGRAVPPRQHREPHQHRYSAAHPAGGRGGKKKPQGLAGLHGLLPLAAREPSPALSSWPG